MGIGFLARLVIVGLVLTGLGMLFASALHTTPAFSSAELRTGPTVLKALESRLHAPAIRTILFVPRLFAMAALPESFAQQVLVCLALLGIGALFLAAAAQLNVSFEEASLHASERQIARLERRRGQRTGRRVMFKRMPPPFRLVPSQHPEIAILWKNLTAALRISGAFIFFIAFILILFVVPNILTHESYLKGVGATMALCFAALFPLAASQLFAQDMRLDVPDMELLKSYPISGERLIAAEISAPLIMMSIIQIVLLSIAALMVHASHPNGSLAFFGTAQFVVVALLFTLPICATQLVIRNAIVVLLPGWSVRSGEDQRGFAVIGQRLVTLGGNLIVLAIALLPAAALFVPALLVSRAWFAGSAAVLAVATVPSVALLCWEVWMAIKFLGAQFDRVDVTTEIGIATL
jgi:hypothetical protein